MTTEPARRAFITALAALPFGGAAMAAESGGQDRRIGSKTLVAYFSRSGNTRVVAGLIHRALGTDLFEMQPTTPYPEDYLETVEQARQERDRGHERPLAAKLTDSANYETVFVGFPIWGQTAPPVVRAFLSAHDLSGKTVIPFITHGGYGLGNSHAVLARYAPKARLHEGFVMEAEQERRTMDLVSAWMRGAELSR